MENQDTDSMLSQYGKRRAKRMETISKGEKHNAPFGDGNRRILIRFHVRGVFCSLGSFFRIRFRQLSGRSRHLTSGDFEQPRGGSESVQTIALFAVMTRTPLSERIASSFRDIPLSVTQMSIRSIGR